MPEVTSFDEIAKGFDERVRRIVWCTVTTVDTQGRPFSRILHPIWEGCVGWIATGSSSGTGTFAACSRRGPPRANGTRSRKSCNTGAGVCRPSNGSHSRPGRMFMAARKPSICACVIRPAWLSLWPANGRP